MTVTAWSYAAERLTVNVNVVVLALPSDLLTLLMLIRGSLSTIVAKPTPSAKNAFVGGMTGAIWVAAAIAVAGAIVAQIALPAREGAEVPMAADGDAFEATAA